MNFSNIPLGRMAPILGGAVYIALAYLVDRALTGRSRSAFRFAAIGIGVALFFLVLKRTIHDTEMAAGFTKVLIALFAAAGVFYEQHRASIRRPLAERWKRFFGATLGVAAIVTYFNGLQFGSPRYYHSWEFFHYYVGAKYFGELGYDGLYRCSTIAQDELGTIRYEDEDKIGEGRFTADLSKEARHPDMKIRNLGGDNLLMPVTEVLAHPETCKSHFAPERWEAFKHDIAFFRIATGPGRWKEMLTDHGFNPPPVWIIAGKFLADLRPASTRFLQLLGIIDPLYLLAMFAALGWAFGWRIAAVGAIFWGCQASAPSLWTYGAFLRQDWLFFLVLCVCLLRKRYYTLAGAAIIYSALLRIFPGLVLIGLLIFAAATIVREKRMPKHHIKTLMGGVLAAALLIPLSIGICGRNSYQDFYHHTLEVHDRTPLTNHMGLRVLVSHNVGSDARSGRMKYTRDMKLRDPFEVWMRMRNERYARYKVIAYAIVALSIAFFAWAVRRMKSLWLAACLSQVFIILLSQLTNYYYVFMVLMAPLTKARRSLESWLFGFAALSQFVYWSFAWNDDKYTALTLISLVLCYSVICAFAKKEVFSSKAPLPLERALN